MVDFDCLLWVITAVSILLVSISEHVSLNTSSSVPSHSDADVIHVSKFGIIHCLIFLILENELLL